MTPDFASVALRALLFVALYQAAGATLFLWLFDRELSASRARIVRCATNFALAGIPLAIAHQSMEAARMADGYNGLIDVELLLLAWNSTNATAHFTQAIGLLAIVLGLRQRTRGPSGLALAGAILVALAPLLTGHTSIHAQRWLLAPLLALHLLIVTFWFGALWPLQRVTRDESPATAAGIVARFSLLAGWSVPLIAVAGVIMTLLLAPLPAVLDQPYGKLLLAKLGVFGLLMLPAAYNKWRLVPAMSAGMASGPSQFRLMLRIELALIACTLTLTAVLTTFYSPEA